MSLRAAALALALACGLADVAQAQDAALAEAQDLVSASAAGSGPV